MALPVTDIYNQFCYDVAEDYGNGAGPGLSLGLLTFQQWIDLLNEVLVDFMKRTGLVKQIYTQEIVQGQNQYTVPDTMALVEAAYVGGVYLEQSTTEDLYCRFKNWKVFQDVPQAWHDDSIPIKTVELAPVPSFSSPAFTPQSGDWAVTIGVTLTPAGIARGLTLVGTLLPTTLTALGQSLPIPDEFALTAINYGVLARVYSGDNELADPDKAAFCLQEYENMVALGAAIASELNESE